MTGLVFYFELTELKKVYLFDNELYFYSLFSSQPYAISLEQLRELNRSYGKYSGLFGIYTATFMVEGGTYDVKFMKNKLIGDLDDYLFKSVE